MCKFFEVSEPSQIKYPKSAVGWWYVYLEGYGGWVGGGVGAKTASWQCGCQVLVDVVDRSCSPASPAVR